MNRRELETTQLSAVARIGSGAVRRFENDVAKRETGFSEYLAINGMILLEALACSPLLLFNS
jgi:hypothetical protein